MPKRTFVIGHKNPDADSIVSAVIRETLLAEMTSFRGERGYASLLLMVVDIVHSQTDILVVGMEDVVAAALDQPLASAHSIMVGGVMSRKKQDIPALLRVAALGDSEHRLPRDPYQLPNRRSRQECALDL